MSDKLTDAQWSEIKAALYRGEKISAIKLYREATGLDLKESKEAIDALNSELRASSPDKFSSASSTGCFGVIAFSVSTIVLLIFS